MVKQVERLGAELDSGSFDGTEILEQRSIQVGAAGTVQNVAARVAEGEGRWNGESGLIEPMPDILTARQVAARNSIRPAARARVDGRVVQRGSVRQSGLGLQKTID